MSTRRERLQPEWDEPAEVRVPVPPLPPLPASPEPRERRLDYTLGLTEAQRAHLDHLRAKNTPSPAENLEELEMDTRAGRTAKLDLRVAPDEKVAWSEAARVKGMSTSEWIRAQLNLSAREVLTEA